MSIPVHCPSCREQYHLADEMAGKFVRCRKCQDNFEVPNLDAPVGAAPESRSEVRGNTYHLGRPLGARESSSQRGRGRSRDRDDGRAASSGSSDSTVVWAVLGVLGAVVLLVVLICGGIIWMVSYQTSRTVDKMVDQIDKMKPPAPPIQPVPPVPLEPPPPPINNLQDALAAVRSADPRQKERGAEWLGKQKPDPDATRRQEVVKALEPLVRDADLKVRVAAHHAQVRWIIGR
jgi:hypothetical protein